jgi:thiol-disulfide isomerase/thioredoxin
MHASPSLHFLVAGLCAQWCGTCRDWRAVFDAQAREQGARADFIWVDVEDHDEVMGSIDVENFPTLLIARNHEVLFFGTITPHAGTLSRLVREALHGHMTPVSNPDLAALVERVRGL